MKVKIKNFQSIKEADLEVKGFTTIVGKTNIGKSAIVRAIDGALTNLGGDFFVRQGEKTAEVQIECENLDLHWKKGGGHNDYIINGEVLESVGYGPPPQIAEAGFKPIESSRSKINVQVASQFNPIFLLDPTVVMGSEVAEIVSDIGRLGEVQEAFKNTVKDRKTAESTIRVRDKDLAKAKRELEAYEGYEAVEELAQDARSSKEAVSSTQAAIQALEAFQKAVESAQLDADALRPVTLLQVPEWFSDALVSELEALEHLYAEYKECFPTFQALEGVGNLEIPELEVEAAISALEALTRFQSVVIEARNELESLASVQSLPEVPEVDLTEHATALEGLEAFYKEVSSLQKSQESLLKEVEDLETGYTQAQQDFQKVLEEAGQCPLCERSIA